MSPGDIVGDRYRIDRVLRGGGVGVVVLAWHLQLEERVAIKFMRASVADNAEAVARFEREARAAFKIRSEYVARVIDVGRCCGRLPYIVMEYLEGADLADVLAQRRRLPVGEAVEYGVQLCAALHAAHSLGVVHRDIKPENLFATVRADGSRCLKVLDFGLSKVLAAAPDGNEPRSRSLTISGSALGTPQYMSPEQWMSAGDVDARADLWAVGVILYELIAGVTPFAGQGPVAMCRAIMQQEPVALRARVPAVPEVLSAVVMGCLHKKVDQRPATALDLKHALEPFVDRAGAEARPIPRRVPASSHLRVAAAATGSVSPAAAAPTGSVTAAAAAATGSVTPAAAAPTGSVTRAAAAPTGSVTAAAAAPTAEAANAPMRATTVLPLGVAEVAEASGPPLEAFARLAPSPPAVGEDSSPLASAAGAPRPLTTAGDGDDDDDDDHATWVMDPDRSNVLRDYAQLAVRGRGGTVVIGSQHESQLRQLRDAYAAEHASPTRVVSSPPPQPTRAAPAAPRVTVGAQRKTRVAWVVATVLVVAAVVACIWLAWHILHAPPP